MLSAGIAQAGYGRNEMYPCINDQTDYGLAVAGIAEPACSRAGRATIPGTLRGHRGRRHAAGGGNRFQLTCTGWQA